MQGYRFACEADERLESALPIAYDEKLGYLTHCLTNLGTGMRASVMLFLPALTEQGAIGTLAHQLSKLGLTIRGLYGEGSKSYGCLYQVSNQITLGVSEEETLSELSSFSLLFKTEELSLSVSEEVDTEELSSLLSSSETSSED